MSTSEVNLNDPLNWYIADSMADYNVRLDPETAKEIVHRHNGYPKLVNALKDAIAILEKEGMRRKGRITEARITRVG